MQASLSHNVCGTIPTFASARCHKFCAIMAKLAALGWRIKAELPQRLWTVPCIFLSPTTFVKGTFRTHKPCGISLASECSILLLPQSLWDTFVQFCKELPNITYIFLAAKSFVLIMQFFKSQICSSTFCFHKDGRIFFCSCS